MRSTNLCRALVGGLGERDESQCCELVAVDPRPRMVVTVVGFVRYQMGNSCMDLTGESAEVAIVNWDRRISQRIGECWTLGEERLDDLPEVADAEKRRKEAYLGVLNLEVEVVVNKAMGDRTGRMAGVAEDLMSLRTLSGN